MRTSGAQAPGGANDPKLEIHSSRDMGISQLTPIIQILFPQAISVFKASSPPAQYEHVLLDLNCLLYLLRTHDQDNSALILSLLQYIDGVLHTITPKSTLFLALDGPGTTHIRILFYPSISALL